MDRASGERVMTEPENPPPADPTILTMEALVRGLQAERDYTDGQIGRLVERLDAMDKATKVLHETVTRTPTEIQRATGHLRELAFERMNSISREIDLMLSASKEAITKAETANEKRFEEAEQWRAQAIDRERAQQEQTATLVATFMPREVAERDLAELRRAIAELTEKTNKIA
jgi:chromosome segregation ATPase